MSDPNAEFLQQYKQVHFSLLTIICFMVDLSKTAHNILIFVQLNAKQVVLFLI